MSWEVAKRGARRGRGHTAEKADNSLSSNNDDDGALQDVCLALGNDQRAALQRNGAVPGELGGGLVEARRRVIVVAVLRAWVLVHLVRHSRCAVSKAGHIALLRSPFSA